ncbi:hypothetical protein K474DRAFT_1680867 [Panus rudis PR-1116 ss-1]|nr:hypothetical protein K474DRAFT_1680867 [Panus rudis PR-1116 ss-1]
MPGYPMLVPQSYRVGCRFLCAVVLAHSNMIVPFLPPPPLLPVYNLSPPSLLLHSISLLRHSTVKLSLPTYVNLHPRQDTAAASVAGFPGRMRIPVGSSSYREGYFSSAITMNSDAETPRKPPNLHNVLHNTTYAERCASPSGAIHIFRISFAWGRRFVFLAIVVVLRDRDYLFSLNTIVLPTVLCWLRSLLGIIVPSCHLHLP